MFNADARPLTHLLPDGADREELVALGLSSTQKERVAASRQTGGRSLSLGIAAAPTQPPSLSAPACLRLRVSLTSAAPVFLPLLPSAVGLS